MAENKKGFVLYADEIETNYNILYNVKYCFSDAYGISYLTTDRYHRISKALSYLRRVKEITGDEYHLIRRLFEIQHNNLKRIKDLEYEEPRLIAQKFIGKSKIRNFIFKRDNYECLRCLSKDNLTIDHIIPINRKGENILSNLQTLCKSCNSTKGINIIDYRYG